MKSRAAISATLALALAALTGCTSGRLTTLDQDHSVPAALQLVAFDDCETLLGELRSAAKANADVLGRYGTEKSNELAQDGPAAAGGPAATRQTGDGAASEYSGTNTHEAGVDEPDLVKTDGRRIVTVSGGSLRVVDAASAQQTGTVRLDAPAAQTRVAQPSNLMLFGDRALVLTAGGILAEPGPATREALNGGGSRLILVDLAGQPRVLGTYTVDGWTLDARQVGAVVRVVVRSAPQVFGSGIDSSSVQDWLPRYTVTSPDGEQTDHVPCQAVSRPEHTSAASLLTILTFDLERSELGNGDPVSVVGDGQTVYSTGSSLYIAASNQWRTLTSEDNQPQTDLYRFDVTGTGKPRFTSAGSVPGWLLNQYSLSEWDGYLRVATTTAGTTGGAVPLREDTIPRPSQRPTESWVYVLRRDAGLLSVAGKIGGLGKGERVYAVRFAGSTGYVVTFRQTDPLYTLDLRDPARPEVLGELKITGYSAYLHPIDGDRLIGIGQEATTQGRTRGTQVSLFDVSNLRSPNRLAAYHVPGGRSEAEFDPHAFLYWPGTSTLVVPLTVSGARTATVLSVSDAQLTERGRLDHADGSVIRRSLVIDSTLWTVSTTGLEARDLATLEVKARIDW
ncbi:MAG: benzoate transporter [Dactylosporangium sp.]|nr:beta-propeller domain-containing protein [Dactylosporangium sp.]NNJ61550.1 benzoate transporter [Dactylosporangium sp.]